MKVISVGDPHFRTDNIAEVNLFIDKMEDLAKTQQPDLIVILGDVLHTHERLHTLPLNKAYEFIERMRNIAKTFVLVGNHDMCFAKNTPILMWDGTVKNSENISVGDMLVGDDNKPRRVLSTMKGKSKMYTIKQLNAIDYTVTENHILSLLPGFHKSIFWNNTKKRWTVKWIENLKLRSKFFKDKNDADVFLHTIPDCDIINISVKDYLTVPKNVRDRLYGFKSLSDNSRILTAIRVEESTEIDFFGWETDGNNRFLLSDLTVVHNCNNQQFLSPNHWMNGMKEWDNVEIIDTVVHRKVNGIHLVFCPYVPPGRFQEALSTNEEDWKKADCIFAHQEFYGCKMGAIVSVEGDKWPEDFPKVVSGHIHERQTIQKNIYYCGSSMQHAFGESDKNIIPILTWTKSGKPYKLEEVDLELPRKKIIYTDVQSMEDYQAPETEDKIKITISGVYDEFKAFKKTKKYRELVKQGTKIVFKPKKIKKEEDDDGDEKKGIGEPMEETDFNRILSSLISKEKSNFLFQVFELVVHNKTVEEEDILFL